MGCVGAGTGARVAAIRGNERASKGGIGSAALALPNGLVVGALFAVNSVGNVLGEDGAILAGLRAANGAGFVSVLDELSLMSHLDSTNENTVIGVVATNGKLRKPEAQKVAQMAHDGIARAVNPAHTMFDGDTIFALATGEAPADPTLVGAFAAEMTAKAIRRAVRSASTLAGVRAICDD